MASIFDSINTAARQVSTIGTRAADTYSGIRNATSAAVNGDFSTAIGAISAGQSILGGVNQVAAGLGSRSIQKLAGSVGNTLGQLNRAAQTASRVNGIFNDLSDAWSTSDNLVDFFRNGFVGGAKTARSIFGEEESRFKTNSFTAQHFLRIMLSRGDPLLAFEWVGFINDPANPAGILPSIYVDAIDTPSLQYEKNSLYKAGINTSYAGALSVSELGLTLYSDTTGKAFRVASSWFGAVRANESGNYRLPRDYKKEIVVYIFDAKRKAVVSMHIHGTFPVAWEQYSLNESADPLRTRLQLSVDTVEFREA